MSRFWDWLDKEPTNWRQALRIIIVFTCANFAWAAWMMSILIASGIRPTTTGGPAFLSQPLGYILPVLFVAAAFEEMIFRLPLIFFARATDSRNVLVLAVAVFSALFGLAHGGLINLPIQGVAGVLLSVVFLKCGGLHNRPAKGLLASTTTHFLFNAVVFALVKFMR